MSELILSRCSLTGEQAANDVVKEIVDAGGQAVADYNSVEYGDKIIDTAIANYKRVDVLINNAGVLRDITIKNMTDQDWDVIMAVHLTGAYKTTRAAWPYFRKQRYGRVINTSSSSGLFGNFGQGKRIHECSPLRQPLIITLFAFRQLRR